MIAEIKNSVGELENKVGDILNKLKQSCTEESRLENN